MRHARDDGPVDLARLAVAQRLGQRARDPVGAGQQQDAGRVLVQPVHQLGLFLVAELQRLGQAVDMPLALPRSALRWAGPAACSARSCARPCRGRHPGSSRHRCAPAASRRAWAPRPRAAAARGFPCPAPRGPTPSPGPPSTRTCPVRHIFSTAPWVTCGKRRLNQRSSRCSPSSSSTVSICTALMRTSPASAPCPANSAASETSTEPSDIGQRRRRSRRAPTASPRPARRPRRW